MELTKKQMIDERDMIVSDLFGHKNKNTDIKSLVSNFDQKKKASILERAENHLKFYHLIANEDYKKDSYRISVARVRAIKIYPQLINLLRQ